MRTLLRGALAVVLLATVGCNLTLDPDSVKPKVKAIRLGACAKTPGGHQACGGLSTQGALGAANGGAHRVSQVRVTPAAIPRQSGLTHQVLYSHVSD